MRHNLSLNRCFEKESRPITEPGKGSYWTVNPNAPEGNRRIRKRRPRKSKSAQAAQAAEQQQMQHDEGEMNQHDELTGDAGDQSFSSSSSGGGSAPRPGIMTDVGGRPISHSRSPGGTPGPSIPAPQQQQSQHDSPPPMVGARWLAPSTDDPQQFAGEAPPTWPGQAYQGAPEHYPPQLQQQHHHHAHPHHPHQMAYPAPTAPSTTTSGNPPRPISRTASGLSYPPSASTSTPPTPSPVHGHGQRGYPYPGSGHVTPTGTQGGSSQESTSGAGGERVRAGHPYKSSNAGSKRNTPPS